MKIIKCLGFLLLMMGLTNVHAQVSGVKINGEGVLELGYGLTKEANAGKMCYGCFTDGSLNIVGGGTTSANRKIKFWSEGGMEIGASVVTLSKNATLKFADRGEIASNDNNHRIRFHRPENIMEFLEFGEIVFSTGANAGVSTNQAIISRNGSLGLGTMTPSQKLQVEGNSYLNGVVGVNRAPDPAIALAVKGSLDVKNSLNNTVFHVSSGKELVFVGTDAYTKYQSAATNGLINTNDYSLWVSKGINAQDFAMSDVSEWNDFVFADNYQLPSLQATEAFIKTNKHLPYIPSEAEVVKKGYSLHTLNRGFLQTIEELTLHSIAQEKTIMAQQTALNNQAEQIKNLANELAEIKALLQHSK